MEIARDLLEAVGLFAVTNIDDIVILALFFAQAQTSRSRLRIVVGQYGGFGAILAAAVIGVLGASLLPTSVIPYFGLLPIIIDCDWCGRHGANTGTATTVTATQRVSSERTRAAVRGAPV